MIYALYVVLLVAVVYLSMKLGDFVDLLDKKTNISGAFIKESERPANIAGLFYYKQCNFYRREGNHASRI